MAFLEKLRGAVERNDSLLCIGLDPDLTLLPTGIPRTPAGVVEFNRAIVAATADIACAYKPNLAFYEALGPAGCEALEETLQAIPSETVTIGDAKRGDIGNTARMYAESLFHRYGFDAATVSPYLGRDALDPFLAYADRGILVLCRTSNAGGADVQGLLVRDDDGTNRPLYEIIARKVGQWNGRGNCGLVVGATAPIELERIRDIAPDLPILIPGIGAQGGDLAAAVAAHRPNAPAIISASRAVLYASSGRDFAEAARAAAIRLRDEMRRVMSVR